MVLTKGATQTVILLEQITGLEVVTGKIWARLNLATGDSSISLLGLTNAKARAMQGDLRSAIQLWLLKELEAAPDGVQAIEKATGRLFAEERYLSNHDIRTFVGAHRRICALLCHPLFDTTKMAGTVASALRLLVDALSQEKPLIRARNAEYVCRTMAREGEFFDSIESKPLTEEQRRAAVVFEDRNLVVAAAGSGKTSVIVAKVGHALRMGLYRPEEILVLAFNRDAQRELDDRIADRLGALAGETRVNIKTFHALGLEILTQVSDSKPLVDKVASDGDAVFRRCIGDLAGDLIDSDRMFRRNWLRLAALFPEPIREPGDFPGPQEQEDYERQFRVNVRGTWGYKTLRGEVVKSMQERQIANWLTLEGIRYEYERPYEYRTADRDHRQYLPDFYYPDCRTYHEHFALDSQGRAPSWFKDYGDGVEWKRRLHKEKGTELIETRSAQFRDGTWVAHLDWELSRRKVPRRRLQDDEIQKMARNALGEQGGLMGLICTFVKHAKSIEATPSQLEDKANRTGQERAKAFIQVVLPIMARYEAYLRDRGSIDFEDMISCSRKLVESGAYRHPYRLILVDEFQDISQGRASLVRAFLDQKPGCKLVAVGDDWQAINRFAGADISIMTNFERHFGTTERLYLTKTFRCHQGIADVGRRFVLKNPSQIRKPVSAIRVSQQKTVRLLQADDRDGMPGILLQALERLDGLAEREGVRLSVMLLGRYRHLAPQYLATWCKKLPRLDIRFMTIHGAKGLEADYVFVLAVTDGRYGFPSNISDDPLLNLVTLQPEELSHAEERRLLYVALTRARRCAYLVTVTGNESCFVRELKSGEFLDWVAIG